MIVLRNFSDNRKKVAYHLDGKDDKGRFIIPVFSDGSEGKKIYF